MNKVKIFKGVIGKTIKVNMQLEFYVPEDEDGNEVESMTTKEVIEMIVNEERVDLGEKVLNNLHTIKVVSE